MQRLFKTIGVASIVALTLAVVAESSAQAKYSVDASASNEDSVINSIFWLGYKIAFCFLTGPTQVVRCVFHDLDHFHPSDEALIHSGAKAGAHGKFDNVIPLPDLTPRPLPKISSVSRKNQDFPQACRRSGSYSAPLEQVFRKGKTRWLLLLMWLLASPPPMVTNQCRPRRGRASSSASWMHSGRHGAAKLAARLQKTLIYYHTILGPDRSPKEGICTGGPHANNTRHCGGLRWHLSQCDGITEQYGHAHRDGRDEQPNL
jgi:hypothetical protein